MLKNKNTIIFCCSFNDNTGEGLLAKNLLVNLSQSYPKKKFLIYTLNSIFLITNGKIFLRFRLKKEANNKIFNDYLFPFILLIKCISLQKNYTTCFFNYLPLWNFLIFLLLPSKVILGPITGNQTNLPFKYFLDYPLDFLYRKFIISLLNYISRIVLKYKNFNFYWAATKPVSNVLGSINHVNFSPLFLDLSFKTKKTFIQKESFVFMYSLDNKPIKNFKQAIKFVRYLDDNDVKVVFVGNELNLINGISKKNISHNQFISYLKKAKVYYCMSYESAGFTSLQATFFNSIVFGYRGSGAEFFSGKNFVCIDKDRYNDLKKIKKIFESDKNLPNEELSIKFKLARNNFNDWSKQFRI